ncbi:MAG: DUF2795 domain-containing protein [Chloroflexi bacterium]|nr:DUF2795 domain-containing protein [Chloroflexota bacterium]
MASTAEVSQVLEGIDFPASKQDVLNYARQRNAPQNALDTLNRLPDQQYLGMAGIWHAVGEVT